MTYFSLIRPLFMLILVCSGGIESEVRGHVLGT